MKKFFTLLVSMTALATAAMAQHGSMNFVGNGYFGVPAYDVTQDVFKDTVIVSDNNTAITLPPMTYTTMHMTIPSLKFEGLSYTMTGSYATGDMAFNWKTDSIDTDFDVDGATKHVTGSLDVTYTHATGALKVYVNFKYGSMPANLTYEMTGYYTTANSWNLVGRGTKGNPYKLYDAADFKSMADSCTATNNGTGEYFQLMNAVDFTDVTYTPIAYTGQNTAAKATVKFNGVLDGNDQMIFNLVYNDPSAVSAGLIGTLDTEGVVKNLTIDETCSFTGSQYIGAIAGMTLGRIEGCTNEAAITATGTSAAGIAGNVQAGATIYNCNNMGNVQAATYAAGISGMAVGAATFDYLVNYGTIKVVGSKTAAGKAGAAAQAGGVLGTAYGTVSNCVNYGEVINNGFDATLYPDAINELTSDGKNAGGIAAWAQKETTISQCYNYGKVTGLSGVGGILGIANQASIVISECTNKGEVTGTVDNVSGIVANAVKDDTKATACVNYGVVTAKDIANAGNIIGNAAILTENCSRASNLEALPLDTESITIVDPSSIEAIEAVSTEGPAYDLFGHKTTGRQGMFIRNGRVMIIR